MIVCIAWRIEFYTMLRCFSRLGNERYFSSAPFHMFFAKVSSLLVTLQSIYRQFVFAASSVRV